MYDFIQYPSSVRGLAEEIKRVCNDYYSRNIDNEQLRDCVFSWANNCPEKFFSDNDLNITVKLVIGKKRVDLLNKLLDGYQSHFRMLAQNKRGK